VSTRTPRLHLALPCAALFVVTGARSSWSRVQTFEGWSLFAEPPHEVDVGACARAYDPALAAVIGIFGEFRDPVRVYAFAEEVEDETSGVASVPDVPGIGRARACVPHAR